MTPTVYDEIAAERDAQVGKGRDASYDDKRSPDEWIACLFRVLATGLPLSARREMWIKIGSVAVAAVEAHDRGRTPPELGQRGRR